MSLDLTEVVLNPNHQYRQKLDERIKLSRVDLFSLYPSIVSCISDTSLVAQVIPNKHHVT